MMKRFLVCLLALALLCAAWPAMAEDEPRRIILGGTGDDSATMPLAHENGDLILSICSAGVRNGEKEYPRHARKVWLLRLSPEGKIVWETSFGEEKGFTNLSGLSVTAEGELSGIVSHTINQVRQYRQPMRFSLVDGAVLWQGEKVDDAAELYPTDENGLKMLMYRYTLESGRKLEEEVHDSDASCEPRLYRLLNADGSTLWTVNAKEIGMSRRNGQLEVSGGTLLYGSDWDEALLGEHPVAQLINDEGTPVWYMRLMETEGVLRLTLLDSEGRAVLCGTSNEYERDEEGHWTGEMAKSNQLLLCLHPKTGDLLWRQENDRMQQKWPVDNMIETESGYLLADSNQQYSGLIYQLVNHSGETTARWETTKTECTFIGARLFMWGQELWTEGILEDIDGDMDVLLERVDIPDAGEQSPQMP